MAALVAATALVSCTQEIDDVNKRLDDLEKRVSALEEIAKASKNGDVITSVTPIQENTVLIGYHIEFQKGNPIDVYFGKDGANGQDGKDGKDGDSMFQSVNVTDTEVTFVTSDGQTFVIRRAAALSIEFDSADLVVMGVNATRNIHYTITSGIDDITIEALSSADIKVKVVPSDSKTGALQVKTGATIDEYSKVVVLVSNGSQAIMRTLNFEEEAIEVEENTTKDVSDEGGEVTLEFFSNVPCHAVIPEDAQSWISVAPETKAIEKQMISLILQPNTGADRSATVIVQSEDGSLVLPYLIEQGPNDDYQLALEREVLIAFYDAMDGPNWIDNTNWCSDRPLYEWYGVGIDGTHVTSLSLENNRLKGSIPDLSDLKELQAIDIIENSYGNIITDTPQISNWEALFKLENLRTLQCGIGDSISWDPTEYGSWLLTIPPEIKNLKNLEYLEVWGLKGPLPEELFELENLKTLWIPRTYLNGPLPAGFGKLKNLETLYIAAFDKLDLDYHTKGPLPDDLFDCTNLQNLWIQGTQISGTLSSRIGNLTRLHDLQLEYNELSGPLPPELATIDISTVSLMHNHFSGKVPAEFREWPAWNLCWGYIMQGNDLDISECPPHVPEFQVKTLSGETYSSSTVSEKKLSIYYQFATWCPFSPAFFPYLKSLYSKYKDKGLDIVSWSYEDEETIRPYVEEQGIPGICFSNGSREEENTIGMQIWPANSFPQTVLFNSDGEMVRYIDGATDEEEFVEFVENWFGDTHESYESTDYSADGTVHALQAHTLGAGIPVVLMGDAFSDRLIADGTYGDVMQRATDALFSEEPYKSFRNCFDVSYVDVVSKNEVYGGETALSTWYGDGTFVGGDNDKVFEYARKVLSDDEMDDALLIVMMNRDYYAGTCYMYSTSKEDYGRGPSVAYFPTSSVTGTFNGLVSHEAGGHGFAKLADEYAYLDYGAIPDDVKEDYQTMTLYGWWKNVDFTSDPAQVKWAQFIADGRYASEGLGVYEGGATYWTGVWRPTDNSIMRDNTGGFNAPSRYAIWYRIGKLAYGDSWEGGYEDFVAYDAVNRTQAAAARRKAQCRNYVERPLPQLPPPVVVGHSWREELQKGK